MVITVPSWLMGFAEPRRLATSDSISLSNRGGRVLCSAAISTGSAAAGAGKSTKPQRSLSWYPNISLTHFFPTGWGDAPDSSEVTFELTPQGEEVLLVLTHRKLANRTEMVEVAGGWHTHLAILADQASGRTPRPFWSTWTGIEEEYEQRLAAEE
jgi:hypothetical protein